MTRITVAIRRRLAQPSSRVLHAVAPGRGSRRQPLPAGAAVACCALALHLFSTSAAAQSAVNVAVVVNEHSPVSRQIADYYVQKRGIPADNVLRIRTAAAETIDRATYTREIEGPLGDALTRAGLQDRILYLVLTKGVPLRIDGTGQSAGTMSSVDSELTLLYRRLARSVVPVAGRVENPYFLGARPPAEFKPFTHEAHDIYLVTRLDGFTLDDVVKLIDRGAAPVRDGRIVLDQQGTPASRGGDAWLDAAAQRLQEQGLGEQVLLDTTLEGVRDVRPVLGYFSWGANDPRNRARALRLGFVPGSLAATFAASDARTFQEPPAGWKPTEGTSPSTWFAGSGQSLIGDLIREGATGVAGHVAEPYLQSAVRPDILFPLYLAGANLAEAFYAAMPHLSWQTVLIGDPLCAPFRTTMLTEAQIDGGIDADTLLPTYLSARRIETALDTWKDAPRSAVAQAIQGDVLMVRGDRAAARRAYEAATAEAPGIIAAQLQLGMMLDAAGEGDAATERYRQILSRDPANLIALNNLAYRLAEGGQATGEAVSLAERAAKLAPRDGAVLDTLAWVQHLAKDHAAATGTIGLAVKYLPTNADVRLHAAAIHAAAGARALAQEHLQRALGLNPSLAGTPAADRVQAQIEQLAAPAR